jgi:hypothetical protein
MPVSPIPEERPARTGRQSVWAIGLGVAVSVLVAVDQFLRVPQCRRGRTVMPVDVPAAIQVSIRIPRLGC